jgi:hypothetical protein
LADAEEDNGIGVRFPALAEGMRDPLDHFVAVIRNEVPLMELCLAKRP